MTDDNIITPEETERRREHVKAAIACSRLAGMAISHATQEIFDAYIRGEIEARDLVAAVRATPQQFTALDCY
jgi:Antitoxin VbhA